MPLQTEPLAFDATGAAFSVRYGDVYASRDGALGQARHVFLDGNALPARWAHGEQFVIVETGFGLGTNFLAAWQAWRDDPRRPHRLHFVSVELHPLAAAALRANAPPELSVLAGQLADAWPLPLPGVHRCEFEGGAVVLTLALGDAREIVPRFACGADAFFLDGFAPDRNPQIWEAPLLKALARLARPGATLATWCTARTVRDALTAAGFEVQLRAGFGHKRQMLTGHFAPRWRVRRHEPPAAYRGERSAVVIGAGLAGATVAHALARRGWHVQVVERERAPASRASGLPWGLLYPQITADDSVLARLTRAGFYASRRALRTLAAAGGERILWQVCGVFRQAGDVAEEAEWRALAVRLQLPSQFARFVDVGEAGRLLGAAPLRGGWWFADGALVSAATWCAQALVPPSISLRCGCAVERLERAGDAWLARAADGRALASAPVAVVASALDAPRLLHGSAAVVAVRGRITQVEPAAFASLRAGLTGDGYLLHGPDGWSGVGATYETRMPGDETISALDDGRAQASNLARAPRLLAAPPTLKPVGVFDA
ncbi:MAG: tRNA (5-methylaminomethyl-2-thiouridine)(34)-methyltransferase MnmD, partial [Gemmatimonadota bacterium]